jgi:hypothetical protein
MRQLTLGLFLLILSACGSGSNPVRFASDSTQIDTTTDVGAARQDASAAYLLSAFFGLDNGIPLPANVRLCRGAGRSDGMPLIFAHEIAVETLQAGDIEVRTTSGVVGQVTCLTMAPALDLGELRTALLLGEFGSADDDPPATVTVVGNVLSRDGRFNFKGATIAVTPLAPGPTLVYAETLPEAQWKLGVSAGAFGSGTGCPLGTTQAVRAVWAGGVTIPPDGDEAGDAERDLYRVELVDAAGTTSTVVPFALADRDDGDNNHLLCLDVPGTPRQVFFPAGYLIDPNGDLNPDTTIAVTTMP